MKRSIGELQHVIDRDPECIEERTRFGDTPLHLAANWPHGLRLLLSTSCKEFVNVENAEHASPLQHAIEHHCLESVQLLADADSALYSADGTADLETAIRLGAVRVEIVQCLLHHSIDRRRRLKTIAFQSLPPEMVADVPGGDKLLDSMASEVYRRLIKYGMDVPSSLRMLASEGSIYARVWNRYGNWSLGYQMTFDDVIIQAKLLYDAGFHDIDELEGVETRYRTLIMQVAMYPHSLDDFLDPFQLVFISWLVDNGARLDKKDAIYDYELASLVGQTPASHYVAKAIFVPLSLMSWPLNEYPLPMVSHDRAKSLIGEVLAEPTRDRCNCACSTNGCIAFLQFWKDGRLRIRRHQEQDDSNHRGGQDQYSQTQAIRFLRWLDDNTCLAIDDWHSLSSAILRLLTFQELQLTHTCCVYEHHFYGGFHQFPTNDREEIQEEEEKTIQQLEDLVAEFEEKYHELEIHLLDFLDGYWSQRMHEISKPNRKELRKERTTMRELGVVLDDTDVDSEEESEGDGAVRVEDLSDEDEDGT